LSLTAEHIVTILYEVENKFPVSDLREVAQRLLQLGAEFGDPVEQVDTYFAHPVRDFAQTDEALRIRRSADLSFITYKGPKIETATKTRRELEVPLGAGQERAGQCAKLLEALGFRRVAEVRKRRRGGRWRWDDTAVEIALDDVEQLGAFVELEVVATPDQLDTARSALTELTSQLGLTNPEPRSYLELLLDR
jgi:adenylate cyclase class 2